MNARKGTLVISFQNGVSNVDVLRQELGGWVQIARGHGSVQCRLPRRRPVPQRRRGRSLSPRTGCRRVLCPKPSAASPAALSCPSDMLGLAWGKLLINLNNAVNALSGRTSAGATEAARLPLVSPPRSVKACRLLSRAGIRPGKLGPVPPRLLPLGHRLTRLAVQQRLPQSAGRSTRRARSSMADDLAAGRKTEVDYLNGELVALAERLGARLRSTGRSSTSSAGPKPAPKPWAPAALRREVLGR